MTEKQMRVEITRIEGRVAKSQKKLERILNKAASLVTQPVTAKNAQKIEDLGYVLEGELTSMSDDFFFLLGKRQDLKDAIADEKEAARIAAKVAKLQK